MIYNTNKDIQTESVALFGEEADNLLEALDIELGESTIAIGENVYDGAEAEKFLNENGILLYEDHIVLEGRQAMEYKARKAAEKAKGAIDAVKDYKRSEHRFKTAMKDVKKDTKKLYKDNRAAGQSRKDAFVNATLDASTSKKNFKPSINYGTAAAKYVDKNLPDDATKAKVAKTTIGATKAGMDAYNATRNHMRKHPEQYAESSIFDFDIK